MAKKQKRISFNLSDFYVDKLNFENGKLSFGTNTLLSEVTELVGFDKKKAIKILELDAKQPDHILSDDQVAELAMEAGFEFEKVDDVSAENVVSKIKELVENKEWPEEANLVEKSPVITIMGHVDHGKTTLLDTIRKSRLTAKEAGGITQTIGAYQVEVRNKKLTFIDTPGHEAFTQMRANGAAVTDIVIIIVAADDSIMPQTRESIDHAKAAGVPIVVAVNKMDAPGANIEKVKQDLTEVNIVPEDWGGDVPFVPISALKGEGIEDLFDVLLLQSEMLELKSPTNILGSGTVVETNVDKNRGTLVSIIVQNGTLQTGDTVIVDDFIARVKGLTNDQGKTVREAVAGEPVEIYGLGETPIVGSRFVVIDDLKEANKVAATIKQAKENASRFRRTGNPMDLFAQMQGQKKTYNIILKADGLGVLAAISAKLEGLSTEDVDVKVIRQDVGEITSTDITLATASNAHIYSFNVKTSAQIESQLKAKQLSVNTFDIIYKLFEDVELKVSGMTEIKKEEVYTGRAEVRALFSFSKVGTIAGCMVTDGTIKRGSIISVMRNGEEIERVPMASIRIERDQVKEAVKGKECGITLDGFNDIQEGDILEAYEEVIVNG